MSHLQDSLPLIEVEYLDDLPVSFVADLVVELLDAVFGPETVILDVRPDFRV